jgi:hypothetical protein
MAVRRLADLSGDVQHSGAGARFYTVRVDTPVRCADWKRIMSN